MAWHGERWQGHFGSRSRPSKQPLCLSNGNPVCAKEQPLGPIPGCVFGNVPIGFSAAIGGHYGQSTTSLTTSDKSCAAGKHAEHPEDATHLTSQSSTSHMARVAREVPTYREIIARAGMKKL
jgi:hypothetical protein